MNPRSHWAAIAADRADSTRATLNSGLNRQPRATGGTFRHPEYLANEPLACI
jgi:hypothetical protein